MARIYPSVIDKQSPRGERDIFKILKTQPGTENWTVLHSFNLPDHGVRRKGEIDFLIMIPEKGIIVLEVKSHDSIARVDGMWRYGDESPIRRSPFEQAESAMYQFQKRIGVLGTGIPCASAVAFTHTRFAEPSVEWHQWQVIDQASMNPEALVASLLNVAEENLKALTEMKLDPQRRAAVAWCDPRRKLPTSKLIETITSTIRGDFEVHVDPRLLHEQREIEYKKFIKEQFEAIDAMSEEVQILFEGAAGTGKTLLAIEETRRSINEDFKTLFLCFNRLLGNYLRQSLQDENLSIGTIHSFVKQVFDQEEDVLPNNRADFKKLATLARENSLFLNIYNSIVVDEIQDFCAIGADELLTVIIEQNPDARIRLFGDFTNQMVNFGDSISREDFLQNFPSIRKYPLTRNCRNRPGVGGTIELFTHKLDLYRGYRLPDTGNNFKTIDVQSAAEIVSACEREYLRLSRKYLPSSIVILGLASEVSRENLGSNFSQIVTNDHTKWNPTDNRVLSTTVRKFKGLEAQAVILTNFPDELDIDLMYTGISRAIEEVVIIAPQNILAKYAGM